MEFDDDAVVPWTVVRASHALSRVFTAQLAEVGLKPHLFGILATLSRNPGMSSAELARQVRVTPQSMGSLLRGLVADGLVEHPEPRRGQPLSVSLTPDGHELLGRAWPVIARMNRPAALGLTAAEATQLNTLLHRVLAATD
ncbi:putative HTH-type transcriptional regulator [Asanoa ishikariensis]|uniref:Transcriptional regulator, MarR family n=1 Tax=Asanoa ishikariensis TaxID=137265 RepID=A0A1H3U049_9ACTN|nr:MarR family winged helix-turn-helix transcriptional regulator [Asanoa ishikariensis]GIF67651.1 putative HTH-type transcriptional regulator [Asanoa ishikariensis]SDZ54889.1 transcriptional regulator, MarR family [Asanoa ishikariensis]